MRLKYEEVMNTLDLNIEKLPRVIFVEGFDCTGKTYLINKIAEENEINIWEPKYHSDINNRVIPYNDRYVLGIALFDLIEQGEIVNTKPIIVNRGLPSAVVYNELYHQDIDSFNNSEFRRYAWDRYSNPELCHTIYIMHNDEENARKLYNLSRDRNNEDYDIFGSFEDYYNVYEEFHNKYKVAIPSMCGDNMTILSSWDYKKLL